MNSIPNYAAVNSTVDLCKIIDKSKVNLVNAMMRKLSNNIPKKNMISDISIKYSHPKWLIDKWLKNWSKDEVVKLLKWNNSEPEIWFRINILKTSIKEIHKFLNSENIDFVERHLHSAIFILYPSSCLR